MTPSRPYLLRALYEWIVDNQMTPYLLVDAEREAAQIPKEFIENGKIVFNVGPTAVQHLDLANEGVAFDARFGGVPRSVSIPINAIMAIYARENGKGMVFTEEDASGEDEPPPPPSGGPGETGGRKPALKVVK